MNSTIITGIIIIACIILPIWYLIRSQSAGKRKLHNLLAEQGKGGNFEATEHESWGSKIIGIDRDHGMAAFANLNDVGKKVYLADLKLFTRSFVEKFSGNNGSKGAESKLSNISIRFVAKEKGAEDVIFPLYSDHSDTELTNELHIADEWVDKINSSMKKK